MNESICKMALIYWYEQGLTWSQVDSKLGIKSSRKFRKKNNIKSRSRSEAVKLCHANMSEEAKIARSKKQSENQWLKNITPEQEALRNKKWHETYNKNKSKNVESNRQGQLNRFSKPGAKEEFAKKQRETKTKNGTLNGFANWQRTSTHEQRSEAAKKSAETRKRNGYVQPKWTEEQKVVRLKKQHETKIKNGTLYTAHGANSKPNLQFKALLDKYNIKYDREFLINTKSFDFKVGNTLIEINPSITHNSTICVFGHEPIDKFYHLKKSELAFSNDYRCIHVWDWDDKEKIINQLIQKDTLYARNCTINIVDNKTCKQYVNKYHLQGYAKSSVNIGLYYKDELVSIMTFGKPRYNKNYEYELIRYCYSKNVVGGAEKLFAYFIKNYTPNSVISYCDLSKFSGKLYTKLGFNSLNKRIMPSKHWVSLKTNQHITDNLLRQRGFDQLFGTSYGKGTSNEELMLDAGFVEIYDSGQQTFVKFFNKEK